MCKNNHCCGRPCSSKNLAKTQVKNELYLAESVQHYELGDSPNCCLSIQAFRAHCSDIASDHSPSLQSNTGSGNLPEKIGWVDKI